MKTTIITIILGAAVLASCGKKEATIEDLIEAGDLTAIKARRDAIQTELNQDKADLVKLDASITELDPEVKDYALVTAIETKDSVFTHYVEVQGSVMTKDDTQVFPEMSGVMTRLNVREGQYIKKGALIATVDDGGLTQQIAQQEVQLGLAKTTYERQKSLWDQNIGSEIQFLQAKNNYEALQKGIEAMQQTLRKVNVYAPFSGSVEEVITKQGQVVSPGVTPIIRLIGLGNLYVEAEVPENYLPTVGKGTKTIVGLDAIEKEYNSTIRRVNSTINAASRSFVVEVSVPNDRLIKPNLIANLKINDYTNKEAILIPSNVINEDASGDQSIFVVDQVIDQEKNIVRVKRVPIIIGRLGDDGMVEITEGLEPNVRIIAEGAKSLADGEEVQILDYNPN